MRFKYIVIENGNDNANTTKANLTRGSVYTIHTNECIEHFPNKKENAHMQAIAIEFSRRLDHETSTLRMFYRLKA